MSNETYTTKDGWSATKKEHEEILDGYTMEQIQGFYFETYDEKLREVLRPYFLNRLKERHKEKN